MLNRFVLAVIFGSLPGLALAHSGDIGVHGGEIEDANPGPTLHFEVVVKGSTVNVYLSDEDGKPVAAAGVAGTVTVLVNKKKEVVKLEPTASDLLSGAGSFTVAPDLRMLVSVTIGGAKQQALFSRLVP
jgi:hypothetical protein